MHCAIISKEESSFGFDGVQIFLVHRLFRLFIVVVGVAQVLPDDFRLLLLETEFASGRHFVGGRSIGSKDVAFGRLGSVAGHVDLSVDDVCGRRRFARQQFGSRWRRRESPTTWRRP